MFLKACTATLGVVLTLAAIFLGYNLFTADVDLEHHSNPAVSQMTLQQRASHMISYLNEDGKETTLCTATAVGPHALLTASHCNDGARRDISDTIKIDYSDHHYNILAVNDDDRDHQLYLIDGPAFKNFVTIVQGVPVPSESVHFYGFGEGVYPSSLRRGRVRPYDDPSEVDAAAQFFTYDLSSYHGDSGSAIYNDKNEIVGLVSYGVVWYGSEKEGSYALDFDATDLNVVAMFDPELMKKDLWHPSPLTPSLTPSSSAKGSVSTVTP